MSACDKTEIRWACKYYLRALAVACTQERSATMRNIRKSTIHTLIIIEEIGETWGLA